jgi:DUF4097 and DUF4098 domain-containing protein YvlB
MIARALLTILLSGLLLVSSAGDILAKDYWFQYQRVVETGPEAELELNYISGNLEITTTDREAIIIDAAKRVSAVSMDEAQLVADHIEIKVARDNHRVSASTHYLRMRNRGQSFWSKVLGTGGEDAYGEVNWKIQVPPTCRITVVCTSGRISIAHLIGDVAIRSSSSDIEVNSIEGSLTVENSSGTTRGELIFGPVVVRQAQGKIDLNFVEGDIRIKSSTADIDIRQDRGALDLTTSAGNVAIQTNLDSSRDFFVRTESGDITLSIPETSSGDLRIESQTGDIRTDIPIAIHSMSHRQVDGTFGYGGVKISLTSISGDVTVAQF